MTNDSEPIRYDAGVAQLQFYIWGVGCCVIAVCGTLGNVLSITVLSHRRMRKSSTSGYLIAQAIFDILVLLSVFFFFTLPVLVEEWKNYYGYFHSWAYPISLTAQSGGIYTTVAFTAERFIACCYPLQASKVCTLKRARKVIILVTVAVAIYNFPRTMEYYTYYQVDSSTNVTRAHYAPTSLATNYYYRQIYLGYMYVVVMFIVPLIVLFVLNVYLISAVKKSQQTRRQMTASRGSRDSENLTIMVISVVLVFLICQFLAAIDNLLNILIPESSKGPFFEKFQIISTLMVSLNAGTNFVCYCYFGDKFRRVFFQMYSCKKSNAPRNSMSYQGQSTIRNNSMNDKDLNGSSHSSSMIRMRSLSQKENPHKQGESLTVPSICADNNNLLRCCGPNSETLPLTSSTIM